ncbi:MAG: hypothetical protein M3R15_23300 [Acidobacteriota bacterium]|nr:hypothetical protein [Acidobacteriota bacterium]
MFIVTKKESLTKAIERAKRLHPRVRMVQFGEYEVTGSKGNAYMVKCYRDAQNQKIVECECATRDGIACKHGAAVLPLHIHLAAQRKSRTGH